MTAYVHKQLQNICETDTLVITIIFDLTWNTGEEIWVCIDIDIFHLSASVLMFFREYAIFYFRTFNTFM